MSSTTPWELTEYIISWRQYYLNTYKYKIYSPSVLTLLLTYNHQTYTHSNLTSKQINGASQYTHISINTHTHALTHTLTQIQFLTKKWLLKLTGTEVLWKKEGFQFHFKRWKSWALRDVLREWIPNIGSKVSESAKAMSLVFVLLDFEHVGIWRRVKIDM